MNNAYATPNVGVGTSANTKQPTALELIESRLVTVDSTLHTQVERLEGKLFSLAGCRLEDQPSPDPAPSPGAPVPKAEAPILVRIDARISLLQELAERLHRNLLKLERI